MHTCKGTYLYTYKIIMKEVSVMKKFKKAMLSVLILFYLGTMITITIPDEPSVQTCNADPGMVQVGPFDEGAGDGH